MLLPGIAVYKNRRGASLCLSLPHRGRETAERRSGALISDVLETHSPALFHTASALSAPSGHLPLEGKAVDTRETYHRKPSGIALYKNRRGASLRLSLPRMGKGDRGAVDRVLS